LPAPGRNLRQAADAAGLSGDQALRDRPVKYYTGDDWAECDPTKWPDDMHLVVNVALGTGNKQQEMQNLMLIGAAQEKLAVAQGGPVGPLVSLEHTPTRRASWSRRQASRRPACSWRAPRT
jgi:hypothetical protein